MEAKIRLVLDGKEYHAKMLLAQEDLQKLRRESETMRTSVASWGMAVTGFQSALQVLSSQVVPILSKPFEAAGQMEQYGVALKVMLGDADLAKQRLAELVEFAAKTPFELPQVVEAGNKLQALGRYSQETLTFLGDLASASGKPFEQALGAFSKLASGQKGIAIDMFRDLLITTNDWAEATGKGFAKSGEFLGTFEDMLSALPKIIEKKGFAGMMEQQSQILMGKLSNLKDAVGQTMAETGEKFLPLAKDLLDVTIPALATFKDNLGTISPVIGGLTLSIILYTTALKAQTIAENISIASIKNGVIATTLKNIQTRLTTSAQTLATASTLAYGVAQDVLTGKMTVATGTMQLMRLAAMSLGSVLTFASTALAGVTLAWGVYEMTIGKARKEMVEAEKDALRLKLGMNDLQKTLDSMSFEQLENEITKTKAKIDELNAGKDRLMKTGATPTGIAWIDAILTKGTSEIIYDINSSIEGQVEVLGDLNKQTLAYQKTVKTAQDYVNGFNDSTLAGLKTLNQVRDAKTKVSLIQSRSDNEAERKRIVDILTDLDNLEAKYRSGKDEESGKAKKTYEQMVADKITFFEELGKIDKSSTEQFKKYLDEQEQYYSETLVKQLGGFNKFTAEQLRGYNFIKEKQKEIRGEVPEISLGDFEMEDVEFDESEPVRTAETISRLRVEAIRDSLQRQEAEIEQWYSEQTELDLYKQNNEAKQLIDQQYYNRLDELRQQRIERDRESYQWLVNEAGSAFRTIADLEMSGAEKMESIVKGLYSSLIDLIWKALSEYLVTKAVELASHTSTELAKTSITLTQSTIRKAAMAGEAGGGTASSASGGGGGFLGTLLSIGGTILSLFGFEKGGAIVGENGPELIAPIESYADANRLLVTRTVLAVQGSLKDLQLQQAGTFSSKGLEGLLGGHIEAINKWQREIQLRVRGGDLKSAMDNVNSYYNKLEVG